MFQTRCSVRGRIVVLLRIREVGAYIGLQLQILHHLPLGKGVGNHTGVAGRGLDVVEVADGVANHRLTITDKQVLTDGRRRVVIRTVSIVDGLCLRGDECRHPAIGSPFCSLTGVAVIDVAQPF